MADQVKPASPAGAPAPAPVAPQPASAPPGKPPVKTSALASVPDFGGNRGGRGRKDGLAPGSSQATEADKKKDRERKQTARAAAAKLVEPPPLPSALQGGVDTTAAQPGSEPLGGTAAPGAPVVPWDPATLRPLFEELIEAIEES